MIVAEKSNEDSLITRFEIKMKTNQKLLKIEDVSTLFVHHFIEYTSKIVSRCKKIYKDSLNTILYFVFIKNFKDERNQIKTRSIIDF